MTDSSFLISHFFASGFLVQSAIPIILSWAPCPAPGRPASPPPSRPPSLARRLFTFIRPTFVRPQFAVALVRPQLVLLLLRWSHPSDAASTTARTLQENVEDSKPIIVLEDVKVTLNGCKEVNVMLFQMQDVEAYTTVIKVKVTLNGCKEVNVMLFQMQDVEANTTVIKRIVKWQGMLHYVSVYFSQ